MSITQVSHSNIAKKADKIYSDLRQAVGVVCNYDIKNCLYKHLSAKNRLKQLQSSKNHRTTSKK